MSRLASRTWLTSLLAMLAVAIWFPCAAPAQAGGHDHSKPANASTTGHASDDDHMVGMADRSMNDMGMDSIMSRHMEMTPRRVATHEDSTRALAVVTELREAITKYKDVSAA